MVSMSICDDGFSLHYEAQVVKPEHLIFIARKGAMSFDSFEADQITYSELDY